MSKNLRKKLLRDIRQNFVQFAAIFIMCFLSMFVMQAFDSDTTAIEKYVDKYYKDTNFLDMYITSLNGFTSEDLIRIKKINGVKNAELRSAQIGKIRLFGTEKKLEFNFIEENEISKMVLCDGTPFERGSAGIWIDNDFAKRQGIAVGDVLDLNLDGIEFYETVKGIILNPEYMYFLIDETYTEPDIGAYGYAYLADNEYPGENLLYDRIVIDAKDVNNQFDLDDTDKALLSGLRESIRDNLSISGVEFVYKQNQSGFDAIKGDLESNNTLETIFPALFILIALLGIMTTMTRLVTKQRTVIGTFKAIGFGQMAIYVHYMSYPVLISVMGSILGAAAGWWTLGKYIHVSMLDYYSLPEFEMDVSYKIVLTIVIISVMAAVTDYFSCKKLLSQQASTILRSEAPSATGAGLLEKNRIWKKLSFATRWNIRDINRNRLRTLAAIIGITLCSQLTLTAFGANELWKRTESWEYNELTPALYTIGFSSDTDYETVTDYAHRYNGQMVMSMQTEIYGNGDGFQLLDITVLDEGNLCRFQNEQGEYISLPGNGIAISAKAAERLEVKVGDFVRFKVPGQKNDYEGRVVTLYKTPGSQGISMIRGYYESLNLKFLPNTIYTNVTVPESYVNTREEVVSVFSKDAYIESLRANSARVDVEVIYMMVVAVIIGVVVMYNLGVMSFIEKAREIATLKVLGFSTNKIRWILQQQNITVTGIGTILGIVIGYRTLGFLMGQLDADSDFIIKLSPIPAIVAFVVTFLLSLIVNGLISSKVKDINMVEALKGVE